MVCSQISTVVILILLVLETLSEHEPARQECQLKNMVLKQWYGDYDDEATKYTAVKISILVKML